jgi:hypothetical protein
MRGGMNGSLRSRLAKLHKAIQTQAARERPVRHRSCRGRPLDEIVGEVEAACLPECLPLLEEVFQRMLDYLDTHDLDEELEQVSEQYAGHPFLRWLWLLEMGAASLPETLPEIVVRLGHRGKPPNPEFNPCNTEWSECIPWQRRPSGGCTWTRRPASSTMAPTRYGSGSASTTTRCLATARFSWASTLSRCSSDTTWVNSDPEEGGGRPGSGWRRARTLDFPWWAIPTD